MWDRTGLRWQQENPARAVVCVVLVQFEFVCRSENAAHGQARRKFYYALLDVGYSVVHIVVAVRISGDEVNVARSVAGESVSRHPYRRKVVAALGGNLRVGQLVSCKGSESSFRPTQDPHARE